MDMQLSFIIIHPNVAWETACEITPCSPCETPAVSWPPLLVQNAGCFNLVVATCLSTSICHYSQEQDHSINIHSFWRVTTIPSPEARLWDGPNPKSVHQKYFNACLDQ